MNSACCPTHSWVKIFLLNINVFKIDDNKLDIIVTKRCVMPKGVRFSKYKYEV